MNDIAEKSAAESTSRGAMNYRTFVIANPKAGAGAVEEDWPLIERLLRARLPEIDMAFTEGPGHATLLAREALRAGWEMVVAVGGDGTLNEVVNGFFEPPEPESRYTVTEDGWMQLAHDGPPEFIDEDAVLGVIPLGTGGDFKRSVGLMGGHRETIEHFSGRSVREIDVGQIGFIDKDDELACRYFVNIASAGFSGAVDEIANNSWKGLGGTPSFLLATARAFVKWKNIDIELLLDSTVEIEDCMQNIVVANGEFFGGGMWIAPGAELDDGEFQVVVMGDLSRREVLAIAPKIYRGQHFQNGKIYRRNASRISARVADSSREALLDVDGETPGRLPAIWHNHHRALRLKM
jgi:diacylglycerol kinase family enzyme